jgi:hypothetical protein
MHSIYTIGSFTPSRRRIGPRIRTQLKSELLDHSPELRACADIANASKHLVLDQKSWVTGAKQGHAEAIGHSVTVGVPTATATVIGDTVVYGQAGEGYMQDTFVIDVGGQPRDAQGRCRESSCGVGQLAAKQK